MSYVLDALRRAEADRQRGQVPDLHAPAGVGADPVSSAPAAMRRSWVAGIVLVLVLLGIGAAAWWWSARTPAAPAAAGGDVGAAGGGAMPAPESPPALQQYASPGRPLAPAAAPVPPPVALPEPRSDRGPGTVAGSRTPPRGETARLPGTPAMPPMAFGGAFDSPDPKARMLIINGQVWREGDEPSPGWVLERIGLHGARFRVQGRSVEVDYGSGAAGR